MTHCVDRKVNITPLPANEREKCLLEAFEHLEPGETLQAIDDFDPSWIKPLIEQQCDICLTDQNFVVDTGPTVRGLFEGGLPAGIPTGPTCRFSLETRIPSPRGSPSIPGKYSPRIIARSFREPLFDNTYCVAQDINEILGFYGSVRKETGEKFRPVLDEKVFVKNARNVSGHDLEFHARGVKDPGNSPVLRGTD